MFRAPEFKLFLKFNAMSLFRTNSQQPFKGPHQGQNLYQAGADPGKVRAAMIMIQGRGANPQSIIQTGTEIEKNSEITLFAQQAKEVNWKPN